VGEPMAAYTVKAGRLVLVVAPWVMTLGCELVIGDEGRGVLLGGDAAMPGDASGTPDVSGSASEVSTSELDASSSEEDVSTSAEPDACSMAQACIDVAKMCTGSCAQQNHDCMDNHGPPGKDCPQQLAACKMTCLSNCIACAACAAESSACNDATH